MRQVCMDRYPRVYNWRRIFVRNNTRWYLQLLWFRLTQLI